MGFFDFLRREKAITGTPAVRAMLADRTFQGYPGLGGTNLNSQRISSAYVEVQNASLGWIYRSTPAVRTVIDYIARNVAQLGLKLYERVDDDERRHVGDHPAALALRNPNPRTPGAHFVQALMIDFLIYGNAYALKVPEGDGFQLWNVSPDIVGLVGRNYFVVDAYRIWNRDTGLSTDVPPERMLHWRGHNPESPRRGESYLDTLREEVATDVALRTSITEMARAGLSLRTWLERPIEAPQWSDEARESFAKAFANWAKRGSKEAPVLEEGMQLKTGGVTPEDAEYIASRELMQNRVASLFGLTNVPPANEEERQQFYADVLPPFLEQLTGFLDLQILVQDYGLSDYYFEFSREKIMDELYKTLTSASGRPVLTTNEARSKIDLPPLEGGEDLIQPLNVVPIDQATGAIKPSTGVMPIQDPNGPPQDGSHREEKQLPDWRYDDGDSDGAWVTNGHKPPAPGGSKALLLPRRAQKDRRRNEDASDFEAAIASFLGHMERSLKSKRMDAKAVADDRWERNLTKRLERIGRRLVRREGEITAARLASAFDAAVTDEYVRTVAANKSTQIVEAVRANLRASEDVGKVFRQGRESDAPRAALTLATALNTFATKEAASQSPDAESRMKTWIVTSTASDHPEMDGESVGLGETFSNGEDGPPADHPGCQCLLEIDGGGHPPQKAIQGPVKALESPQPIVVNVTMPEQTIVLPSIPEGAIQFKSETPVFVEPAKQGDVYVAQPDVNVAPAELHVHEGAIAPITNVEAGPPAELNFSEGAFRVESPVHVEAPPPADIRFVEGAIQNNIRPLVNVEPPNVNVEVKGGKTKRVVTFSDGSKAEIEGD